MDQSLPTPGVQEPSGADLQTSPNAGAVSRIDSDAKSSAGTRDPASMPQTLTAARDAAAFVAQLFDQPAASEAESPAADEPSAEAEVAPTEEVPSAEPVSENQTLRSLHGLRVLVLGLGASGLAMVRWCARQGAQVTVADTRETPPQLGSLQGIAGVKFVSGPFTAALLTTQDEGAHINGMQAVFKSPGLSPAVVEPVWQAAQSQGLWLGGELDLFNHALKVLHAEQGYAPKLLAVTGTNGKTTTTAMAGELIERAGMRVAVAGNIGPNLLDVLTHQLEAANLPEVWVLELSSFQLDAVRGFEPTAATVLNLSQDHLDWHGDMQAYAAAKARIFGQQALMILNREDQRVMAMRDGLSTGASDKQNPEKKEISRSRAGKSRARTFLTFGSDMPQRPGDYGIEMINGLAWLVRAMPADETHRRRKTEDEELFIQRLMPAGALRIHGRHNASNALAALALAQAVDCPLAPLLYGLREYRGEPHRVQSVGVVEQVEYFDDSKGTNVGATVAALNGLGAERRLVVILGGDGKGQDFSPLAAPVARHARAVILIGRDAPLIRSALTATGVPLVEADSLPQAVQLASETAKSGDAVLLSPACASFDMFDNYEHRARVFVQAVQALALESGAHLEGSA